MFRKITAVSLLLLSLASFSNVTQAASSVWKVEKNGNQLFIAGTLHLLEPADYPLPTEFEKAFQESDIIVFETDVDEIKSAQFQQAMLAAMFNNGTKLKSQLSSETWNKLEKHLAKRGISLMQFNDLKVSMALLTLTVIEYQAMGFTAPGVDATYFEKAQKANKVIKSLETPQEQINFLADMGNDDPEAAVKYTLDELKELPRLVNGLKTAWLNGDLQALETHGLSEMRSQHPKMYATLISVRNEKWLKQIDGFISTPKTEALYVGALHMAGIDGLVARLKEKGYRVKKL